MDVFLATLGCRLNEAELETWTRQLKASGHGVVQTPAQAHVMVLNTCAVTREAARKSRQLARRLHRNNPQAQLVITGCYASLEPEKVAELAGVDLVVGNTDKARLVERLEADLDLSAMPQMATEPDAQPMFRKARNRAFVKVQDGCKNRCTFCIVTIARGQERSRTTAELIEEIRGLVDDGAQEVVLTGVHLGGYGRDLGDDGDDLFGLVQALLKHTDVERLRLGSLEPWDLPDHFWTLWDDPRLCPHLHLPLQSGSDTVLKRMARRCSTSRFAALVDAAREAIPDLSVTTDLIAGFPGETEAEWAETMAFVEQVGFAHMHIFAYSPRAGTTAARMKGHLQKEVKRARSAQMHALAARMKRAHLAAQVGRSDAVLWEGRGEPDGDGWLRWSGYTRPYLRAHTRVPSGTDLENVVTPVQIVGHDDEALEVTLVQASQDGWSA